VTTREAQSIRLSPAEAIDAERHRTVASSRQTMLAAAMIMKAANVC